MIRRRTTSLVVAFAHLLAPSCARRPPLALSLSEHVAKGIASGRPGRPCAAISRHERKRAQKSRSFRRRQAPVTRGQKRTLRALWPKYGLVTDFADRWVSVHVAAALHVGNGGPVATREETWSP